MKKKLIIFSTILVVLVISSIAVLGNTDKLEDNTNTKQNSNSLAIDNKVDYSTFDNAKMLNMITKISAEDYVRVLKPGDMDEYCKKTAEIKFTEDQNLIQQYADDCNRFKEIYATLRFNEDNSFAPDVNVPQEYFDLCKKLRNAGVLVRDEAYIQKMEYKLQIDSAICNILDDSDEVIRELNSNQISKNDYSKVLANNIQAIEFLKEAKVIVSDIDNNKVDLKDAADKIHELANVYWKSSIHK